MTLARLVSFSAPIQRDRIDPDVLACSEGCAMKSGWWSTQFELVQDFFFNVAHKPLKSASYRGTVGFVRDFIHILWICRISTASVALGLLVMLKAPQAVDLFQEVGGFLTEDPATHRIARVEFAAFFGASVLLLWAIPVHGSARWSLDCLANPPNTSFGRRWCDLTEPRPDLNRHLVKYLPRMLGLTCFVAVLLGIRRASDGSFGSDVILFARSAEEQLLYLSILTIVFAMLFVLYVSHRVRLFNLLRRSTGTVTSSEHGRIALAGLSAAIVTLLLAWFIYDPYTTLGSRAMVLPIVLGAWVPLLSVVTWMSYVARLPVLALIIAAIVLLKMIAGDRHAVRTMQSDTTVGAPTRLVFSDAVQLWMDKNGCAKDSEKCPHPIVVAAAGGASRAAYVTASTLGFFMDLTCPPDAIDGVPEVPCNSNEIPAFANRVFAISGVSGGALGAAVFSALLKTQQEQGDGMPCQRAAEGVFWFRGGAPSGWRDCVQLILSEDFLSPPLLGFAFRDQVPFLPGPDRAGLLEDAFIKAFKKHVRLREKSDRPAGLAAPFESFAPDKKHWRPLLIFNGTSVATGRRVLTSQIATRDESKALFADAYDVFRLIDRNDDGRGVNKNGGLTFSLATAVTNSGRFPLLTPPGELWDRSSKKLIDQIVDGGYFENYGVTTAFEIARELKSLGLNPRLLLITNEPLSVGPIQQLDKGETTAPAADTQERDLVGSISAPLNALYRTGSSRGDLAVIRTLELFSQNERMKEPKPVAHVTVYGILADNSQPPRQSSGTGTEFKPVSMSLWLSKPVQEYLDLQFLDQCFSSGIQQTMLSRVCQWLDPAASRCVRGVEAFKDASRCEKSSQ
jgi:hypothetical protein